MTAGRDTQAIARGVLLGTFVGDALGAPWEGAAGVDVAGGQARLAESLHAPVLRYTDDTQLTLALAEHLCDHPAVEPRLLTGVFSAHFEPHRGYARGMFGLIDAWARGLDPEAAATSVFPDGSFGNGAAMRAAPVGVVWRDDPDAADAAARRQAAVTHAHPVGMDAAAVQAGAVATAARSGRFGATDIAALAGRCRTDRLRRALRNAVDCAAAAASLSDIRHRLGTGVVADQSVPTAMWVAATAEDITEAVVLSLALGGDVDTIAAMACAVIGAGETDRTIPQGWLRRLEDGARGRTHAAALAARLARA